jgi:hypothetical protein
MTPIIVPAVVVVTPSHGAVPIPPGGGGLHDVKTATFPEVTVALPDQLVIKPPATLAVSAIVDPQMVA